MGSQAGGCGGSTPARREGATWGAVQHSHPTVTRSHQVPGPRTTAASLLELAARDFVSRGPVCTTRAGPAPAGLCQLLDSRSACGADAWGHMAPSELCLSTPVSPLSQEVASWVTYSPGSHTRERAGGEKEGGRRAGERKGLSPPLDWEPLAAAKLSRG